ncbi:hypothetical protein GTW23_23065 [Hoeflea alexandrii]|uniref:Cytochrome b561 bacterial/Ni-hydrogenase domain-containing protein n=3 Tax=Hoeflea alexandrii TaxID=288436 RepID=A0ABT1CXY5_9HYPH|nr:hypothetical protein [Hoeflea alexandrii]
MIEAMHARVQPYRHERTRARAHGAVTRLLHWLVGGLLVYGLVFPADAAVLADPGRLRIEVAFASVLALLFLVRLLWVSTVGGGSRLPSDAPTWEHVLARLVHGVIYAAVLLMTVTGVALAVTAEAAIAAFGFSAAGLPLMPPQSSLLEVHEALATGLIALIGLHVLGAVWHWLIREDGVWQSMLWPSDRTCELEQENPK